jgi:plasmid stability protein
MTGPFFRELALPTLTGHSDVSADLPTAAGRRLNVRQVAHFGNVQAEACRQILRAMAFAGRQLNAVHCAVK